MNRVNRIADDCIIPNQNIFLNSITSDSISKISQRIVDIKLSKLERKRQRKARKLLNMNSSSSNSSIPPSIYSKNMEDNQSEERLRKKQERTELYKGKLSRSKPLYDNCQLLTKEGKLIATCSEKTLKVCCFPSFFVVVFCVVVVVRWTRKSPLLFVGCENVFVIFCLCFFNA